MKSFQCRNLFFRYCFNCLSTWIMRYMTVTCWHYLKRLLTSWYSYGLYTCEELTLSLKSEHVFFSAMITYHCRQVCASCTLFINNRDMLTGQRSGGTCSYLICYMLCQIFNYAIYRLLVFNLSHLPLVSRQISGHPTIKKTFNAWNCCTLCRFYFCFGFI